MIFITVGAQMPFDRLVRAVDAWAAARGRRDVFAQIGATPWRPRHIQWAAKLDAGEFRQRLFEADAVVTHAGMGTIIEALQFGKPLLVMPRRGDLRETRNDHQFGTARAFADAGRLAVAWEEEDIAAGLDALERMPAPQRIPSHASLALLTAVRSFIRGPASAAMPGAAIPFPAATAAARDRDVRRAA